SRRFCSTGNGNSSRYLRFENTGTLLWSRKRKPGLLATRAVGSRGFPLPAHPLLDHLIGSCKQRWRDRQAEGLGGLQVDNQLELRGLLNREIPWFGALEDFIDIDGSTALHSG